jgi:hypothetical protein
VKLKSPKKHAVRALTVAGVAIASVSGLVFTQAPAFADGGFTYVAVGSDTTQDDMNAWAASLTPGTLDSVNAVNPFDNTTAHEVVTPGKVANTTVTPNTAARNCSYNRPNGSGEGQLALRGSLGSTTATLIAGELTGGTPANLPSNLPQAGCIDIARSSSTATALDAVNGKLIWIPFGVDGVTMAQGSVATTAPTATTAGTSDLPAGCNSAAGATTNACVATPASNLPAGLGFSFTELQTLYRDGLHTADVNGAGCFFPFGTTNEIPPAGCTPIDLYAPQSGSGTFKFFSTQLGFTLPKAYISQTIIAGPGSATVAQFVGQSVEEHDGKDVTVDPNGITPFSIAQYIGQHNGNNPRFHQAVLESVDNAAPETAAGTLNLSFSLLLLREVYNVVPIASVVNSGTPAAPSAGYDSKLNTLLVSAKVASGNQGVQEAGICSNSTVIRLNGFAPIFPTTSPLGLGGEVGGHFCGQIDVTALRGVPTP